MEQPRVTDNDQGEITVTLDGVELRGWSYASDDERRRKIVQAHEYREGWCDGAVLWADRWEAERQAAETLEREYDRMLTAPR